LSFQIKKHLPIGRGGAILTNDESAYKWLKLASYDGRNLKTAYDSEDHLIQLGWHYYMTPEDAARGLLLLNKIENRNPKDLSWDRYPDLTTYTFFKEMLKNA
jgi:dTDP-4-amino-4,6-dideoxygalactose transaminase